MIFSQLSLASEDAYAYLAKVRSNYLNTKSFMVEMDYALYKGHQGDSLVENYESLYYSKSDKSSYRKIREVEIITEKNTELKINHAQKTIILSRSRDLSIFEVSLESSLKICENISIEIKGANRIVHLFMKQGQDIQYSKLSIEINPDFLVQSISIFYSNKINFSLDYFKPIMDYPKLVVTYENYKNKWKDSKELINIPKYVGISDTAVVAASPYQDYKIIDMRTKKTRKI